MKHIAFSLPTGIGANIGGFAGDIGHIVRKFSKHFKVIVNPNAVNGGTLSAINSNMIYLEGYAFDKLLCGEIELIESKGNNKIGVIIDCAVPEDILNVHINTINAHRVVMGLDIQEPIYTKKPLGVEFYIKNDISSGTLLNPDELIQCAKEAISKGADTICVIGYFGEDADDADYSNGTGIDPIGGVEAIISHLVTSELNVVCAHAPAFFNIDISTKIENAKVASECISSTYLPCVLQGLEYAPRLCDKGEISNKDITHLIVPSTALGSKAVLGAHKSGITICAVKNDTKVNITNEMLKLSNIIEFEDYDSCLEFLRHEN